MKPLTPKSSWPLVSVGDGAAVPVVVTSPFDVPQPLSPYDDYMIAVDIVRVPGIVSEYLAGFLSGFAMLTGGMAPDVACGKAAWLLQAAANAKHKGNYGQGATDAWRLLGEGRSFVDVLAGQ